MEESRSEPRAKKTWVPPKILATYTKEELEETMKRLGIHGAGGGGCGACASPTPTPACGGFTVP